jgi:hypothetical protein
VRKNSHYYSAELFVFCSQNAGIAGERVSANYALDNTSKSAKAQAPLEAGLDY